MTETRVQYRLFGEPPADMVGRVWLMRAEYPQTADDLDYAWLRYLELHHGLPAYARAAVMQCLLDGAPRYAEIAALMEAIP